MSLVQVEIHAEWSPKAKNVFEMCAFVRRPCPTCEGGYT